MKYPMEKQIHQEMEARLMCLLLDWPLGYLSIFPYGFHKDPIS